MPITGITSRVSRVAASLGLTKTDARPVRNATREISAAEYNTLADGLVAVQEEVGLHDGSEPGTLVARAFELEKGAIPTANTQTASTATTVVAAATALVRVTYASGTTTLDFSALAVGQMTRVLKANASAYGITIVGDGNDTINGGTAGAAMTLPGSTVAMTSTTSCPSWLIYRESATQIHVMNGPSASSVSDTRDPISTDVYAEGTTWINTAKSRLWRSSGAGAWICISDPGLIWAWNETDLTQFDIVEEASFTRTVTTWPGAPIDAAIQIANPATGTPAMAMLVKTTHLPSNLFSRGGSIVTSCRVNNNTSTGTQDLLTIPYYESMSYMVALRHVAAAATYTRRNGSTTWDDTSPGSGNDVAKGTTSGAALRQAHQVKIPTGSTNPAVSFRGQPAPGSVYINSFSGSWNAGWQSLTWNPRIGWGCRGFGTLSTGNFISSMCIRWEPER